MWYPATITGAVEAEPITTAEAKAHLRVDGAAEDSLIAGLVAAARAHAEAYCGARLATQTVAMKCDGFADLGRLPEAPVQSVASVTYVDTSGDTQTLATSVYELRSDGLEAALVLKYGQAWPATRMGSRITVTAVVGYATLPKDIRHALLLLIGHWYVAREAVNIGNIVNELPLGVAALLCNHRRGA
ncbi:MAG TPA: head-tail connector protein [Azospirillaceae bacterium]|nr:head-tail connector protein [Azospirillaceae bacterium]